MELRSLGSLREIECQDIISLYKEREPVLEIVKAFSLRDRSVLYDVLRKYDVPRNNPQHAAPRQKIDVDTRLAEAKALVAALEAEKAAKIIRFEWAIDSPLCRSARQDGDSSLDGIVLVYGVTPSFIKAGGIARLREFIEREVPQVSLSCTCGDYGVTRPGCPTHDRKESK